MRRILQILHRPAHKKTTSNPERLIVLLDRKSWPTRVLERRGWFNLEVLASRYLTEEEERWLDAQYRVQAFKYNTGVELLEDERFVMKDDPRCRGWIKTLTTKLKSIKL